MYKYLDLIDIFVDKPLKPYCTYCTYCTYVSVFFFLEQKPPLIYPIKKLQLQSGQSHTNGRGWGGVFPCRHRLLFACLVSIKCFLSEDISCVLKPQRMASQWKVGIEWTVLSCLWNDVKNANILSHLSHFYVLSYERLCRMS